MSDTVSKAAIILDESVPTKVITVAAGTSSKGLAGSLAEEFRKARPSCPNLSLHVMGHGAVGQAVKAVPILNGLLAPHGLLVTILPSFEDKEVPDEHVPNTTVTRTVVRLRLIPWSVGG